VRTSLPPPAVPADPGAHWGLRRTARLGFPDPALRARDPAYVRDLAVYLTDMLAPHGIALDGAALDAGGQAYEEMARALIGLVVPDGEPVDLLVLAYAVPDIVPGRSSCVRLSRDCPGVPMAFALSDQGTAAPFTALRLIRQYAAAGEARRALLLVLEQAWLPYLPPPGTGLPTGHAGVAMLFGDAGDTDAAAPARLGPITMQPGTDPDQARTLIRHQQISGSGRAAVVVRGPLLAGRAQSARQPFTGLWWKLADALPGSGRLVAADYDPDSATLCRAVFDTGVPAALAAGQSQFRETV
jgi:hypothetical protein